MQLLLTTARRLLLYATVLAAISLILSAWLPYLDPRRFSPAGFAGLPFLPLWVLNLLLLLPWLFYSHKKYYLFPLGALLLTGPVFFRHLAFHPGAPPPESRPAEGRFTLMTFNASRMGLRRQATDTLQLNRVYGVLKEASPDVLCLQEFYTSYEPGERDRVQDIRHMLGYDHHFFTCDVEHGPNRQFGIILFSRFPVLGAARIPCGYNPAGSGASMLQADLLVHGDTIRVLSVHLQSYMFTPEDFALLRALRHFSPVGLHAGRQLLQKMERTIHNRSAQAQLLAGLIAASPYPVVVCGDFNDTAASFTYNTLRPGLQDAFLAGGLGAGGTFGYLLLPLRIDYILPHRRFKVQGYRRFLRKGFEHFPIMTSLSLHSRPAP